MIPVIDISSLMQRRPKTERSSLQVAEAILKASRAYGSFVVRGHGISQSIIEEAYERSSQFFALPLEEKMRYYIAHNSKHRGYVPLDERGDYSDEIQRCYEAFDLGLDLPADDPDSLSANRLLGPNVWPQLNRFHEAISLYYAQISDVALTICSALERALQIPERSFTRHMERPVAQLRLLHYLQSQSLSVGDVIMGAHTDYECLTLAHQQASGLQVMSPHGEWVDVITDAESLFVHLGDMLEVWTNGWLKSTPHQVVNTARDRLSLIYFAATEYDTSVTPLAQFITRDHPQRYQTIHSGKHIEAMLMRDFPYLRKLNSTHVNSDTWERVVNPFERRLHKEKTD